MSNTNCTSTISLADQLRCICGHSQSSHDRRLDLNVFNETYYYPCKTCDCDMFLIDEEARKKISEISNQQWQRLREQNEREIKVITSDD